MKKLSMFRKLSCHFKNIVDSAQKWQPHFCLHVQAKWVLLSLRFYYITNTVRKNTLRQGHTVISTINLFLFTRDATYLHRYRDWLTQKSMNKRNKSSYLLSFLCLFKWIQIKKINSTYQAQDRKLLELFPRWLSRMDLQSIIVSLRCNLVLQ